MKKIALMCVFTLLASTAGAQMMGRGGMRGQMPGTPQTGPGNMFGDMGGLLGGGPMAPKGMIVTPAGSVILLRTFDANNDGLLEREIVALTPAGTEAWKKSLEGFSSVLAVSDDLLLLTDHGVTIDLTKPIVMKLVALDLTTGVERWQLSIDGIPIAAEPFTNGIYVTVAQVEPNPSLSPRPRGRMNAMTLWSISPTGVVLWKYDLQP